jgi:MFS family permease
MPHAMSAQQTEPTRRRLIADIRPLREVPVFRRLWLSGSVSTIGGQLTNFAIALQVYQLTHSSFAVGAVSLVGMVPLLLVGLFGGSIADNVDRRRLAIAMSFCLAGISVLLALQAFLSFNQLWLLYLLVGIQSLFVAINAPTRQAILPQLLPEDQLAAGIALNMGTFQASMLIGPAVAGVLTAVGGLRLCYLVDAITFVFGLYGLFGLPAMSPKERSGSMGLRSVLDGLRFVRTRPILIGMLAADLNAMVLGLPISLFPAINAMHFGGSAQTLGLLSSAVGLGGVIGSVLSGPLGHVRRPGRGMLLLIVCWGAGIAVFGFTRQFWLALLALAFCGALDNASVVLRTLVMQLVTPDRYRGRVNGLNFVVGAGGPQLGMFEAGLVGSLVSPVVSAVSGGIATIVGAVVIWFAVPSLVRYDKTRDDDSAEQATE